MRQYICYHTRIYNPILQPTRYIHGPSMESCIIEKILTCAYVQDTQHTL